MGNEWINAVSAKSNLFLDYVNQRLNLSAQPINRAVVRLGETNIETSAIVLAVEAGTRSYAIYYALGLGTLSLTRQTYPLSISLLSQSTPVLAIMEQITFTPSDEGVFQGRDEYTIVIHLRDDPAVIWALDNRSIALDHFALACGERSYRLAELKDSGSSLEYGDGFLIIRNPPQCSSPTLRVYLSQFPPYSIGQGEIAFRVSQ